MPSYKGMKLNVISQWELQIHPEFSHPDTSQFSGQSPSLSDSPLFDDDSQLDLSSSKSDQILGRNSTIAVYIPSVSGARFWIRYNISEAAAAISPWFYFKLLMNGRHVTSWGCDSAAKPSGQIMRGLFDPTARWDYKENGTLYKNNGTEIRPFFFATEDARLSASEDGGLIEVMAFRANGRRRKMPERMEFRRQDQWGIMMPTGGLLDNPQEAKFYDWYLRDPKDRPFATFQFHYRSWDSLVSSQIIPAEHSHTLLPASPSLLSLNGHPLASQVLTCNKQDDEFKVLVDKIGLGSELRDFVSFDGLTTPWMTTVFDYNADGDAGNQYKPAALFEGSSPSFLAPSPTSCPDQQTPLSFPTSRFSNVTLDTKNDDCDNDNVVVGSEEPLKRPVAPVTRSQCSTSDCERPLPRVPTRSTSFRKQSLRTSSVSSAAVSITASLRSDSDCDAHSPESMVIGVATAHPQHVVASTFGLDIDSQWESVGSKFIEELEHDNARHKEGIERESEPGRTKTSQAESPSEQEKVYSSTSPRKSRGSILVLPDIAIRSPCRTSPIKLSLPVKESPNTRMERNISVEVCCEDPEHIYKTDQVDVPELSRMVRMDDNIVASPMSKSEWVCRIPSPVRERPEHKTTKHLWGSTVTEQVSQNTSNARLLFRDIDASVMQDPDFPEKREVDKKHVVNGITMSSGNWI